MKAKKVILLLCALCFVVAIPTPTQAVSNETYTISDIDSHWAESEINTLVNTGILRGYNNEAKPDTTITRGEFAALAARTLTLKSNGGIVFDDIGTDHMFYNEIDAAYDAGIINGTGAGFFMPDKKITREEIMLIISRSVENKNSTEINFKDIPSDYPYINELKKAVSSGIVTGFVDNTFRPKENATRSECAVMLKRMLEARKDISKKDVEALSTKFIVNEAENTKNNLQLATGRALEETNYRLLSQEKISFLGTVVEKIPSDPELISITTDGNLANATYENEMTYIVTNTNGTRQRTYRAKHDIRIINADGALKVYDYTCSLSKSNKINLTWEVYSSVPDYAPKGVNVISPSSFQISKENLGVESKPLLNGISFFNSLTRKYMDYARENNYEVWPIYKTDFTTQTSDEFLKSSDARQKSIDYLIQYACKYLIDGINVDFENVYSKNRHLLAKHIRELSVSLHELGLVISVDITKKEPTSANWSMCYDRDKLNENADYIMLMAYDEYYASSKTPGSVASLDWTENSIKLTLGEVDKDKLILGIPFYMRYFETSNGKVTSTKAISMQTAYELINSNNVTYTYIEEDMQYKISWTKNGKNCVFWLESTDTIQKRMNLVQKYNLAGVATWRRGLEIQKVWDVIYQNLN